MSRLLAFDCMNVSGDLYIGYERTRTSQTFRAVDPPTGDALEPDFSIAGAAEVDRACRLASSGWSG